MSERRDPSTLTSVATRRGTCYRCQQPIQPGVEQITAFDGVFVVTYHADCPVYPVARVAFDALHAYLKETQ